MGSLVPALHCIPSHRISMKIFLLLGYLCGGIHMQYNTMHPTSPHVSYMPVVSSVPGSSVPMSSAPMSYVPMSYVPVSSAPSKDKTVCTTISADDIDLMCDCPGPAMCGCTFKERDPFQLNICKFCECSKTYHGPTSFFQRCFCDGGCVDGNQRIAKGHIYCVGCHCNND